MGTPRDRVRRILADGAPPRSSRPGEEKRRDDRNARSGRLRERLKALGLDRRSPPRGDDVGGAHDVVFDVPDDDRALEVQVGGRLRETPLGTFVYVERDVPLAGRHGDAPLADALAHGVPLREAERGPSDAARLDPRDVVFLDTETTGLAGGTGTVAFLVGTGQVEGDHLRVRQYCMRDYPEEPALLHALLGDVGDRPLVTFNGRSFDWPLLVTRLRLHRLRAAPRAHLDLLPPSRRLWVDSVPSHTLSAMETHVLGLERQDDLPGWRIPQAYFDFLRSGRAGLVARAFLHNEVDVVSMLALMGRIGAILETPDGRHDATPRDHLGTARLLLDLGEGGRARRCLAAGVERARDGEASPLLRELGHACRRAGAHDEALAHWMRLARTAPAFDVEAFEQVAKIHEHRRRDFAEALEWVEEALRHVRADSRAEEAFRHREARLRRRLATAGGPRPSPARRGRGDARAE